MHTITQHPSHRPDRRSGARWIAAATAAITAGAIAYGSAGAMSEPAIEPDGPTLVSISPCRLADTRPAPLGPDDVVEFDGWGQVGDCSLPIGAKSLLLNVTAVDTTESTNLRVFTAGDAVPTAANLNPKPATTVSNSVTVGLNELNGRFAVFNRFGEVNVVIDVMGYYQSHHHDDRYYTKDEVDDLALGFGGSFHGAALSRGATHRTEAIAMPDAGSPRAVIAFGLPAGRVPGRPLTVTMPITSIENCSVVLSATGISGPSGNRGLRLSGWKIADAPDGVIEFGTAPPSTSFAHRIVTFVHNDPGGLAAGTSVSLRVVRKADDPADTCGADIGLRGGFSVSY